MLIADPLVMLAAMLSGVAAARLAALLVRPTPRLRPRVEPYLRVPRTALKGPALAFGSPFVGLFRAMLTGLAARVGRLIEGMGEEAARLKVRQSGLYDHLTDHEQLAAFRFRQLGTIAALTLASGMLAAALQMPGGGALVVTVAGTIAGLTRQRGRLERAIEERRTRMRMEIYTVNQLLAIRVRVGGGVVHAVQRLVAEGRGEVARELAEALRLHRAGMTAAEAFGRIARLTPEPHCARTYSVLAAAEERGADLARALLALAEDVRESRRETMRRAATKRRAAMLIPTIAILAPVMLLFVGAPLPSLVLNWR